MKKLGKTSIFEPTPKKYKGREVEKSRKVERQKSKEVKDQGNWKAGKKQVSFWLPKELVRDLKLQAVKEGKKLSVIAVERLKSRKVEK